MKSFVSTILFLVVMGVGQLAMAHGDHNHPPIEPKEAEQAALRAAGYFTTRDMGLGFGQLDKSWNELSVEAAKVSRSENGYFIVAVKNAAKGKTLYVLLSDGGDIYDANFSGEFPKLKQ